MYMYCIAWRGILQITYGLCLVGVVIGCLGWNICTLDFVFCFVAIIQLLGSFIFVATYM